MKNPNGNSGLDAEVARQVKALIAVTRGVTVSGLADTLSVRRSTLSARVNGHAAFTPSQLHAVALELNTTASALVSRAESELNARRPQAEVVV